MQPVCTDICVNYEGGYMNKGTGRGVTQKRKKYINKR